jgi:two-component system OmpR family response regulator
MKKVIAIVEDEPAIRDNYAAAFQRHGYAVRTYGERKEAIDAFRARLPDLAVIDVGLRDEPEGGFELCRELLAFRRAADHLPHRARQRARCGIRLAPRADDYLTKDLSLTHLMARVTALFRRIDALTQPSNRDQIVTRGAADRHSAPTRRGRRSRFGPRHRVLIVHAREESWPRQNRQQLMDAANVASTTTRSRRT